MRIHLRVAQEFIIQWLRANLYNTRWMDYHQVRHGRGKAILVLDAVDVEEAYSYSTSRYHHIQWHIRSYGCRYASFGQEEDSGMKTYTSLWSLGARSCPNIILKLLLRLQWLSFQHISLILSGSCNHLRSGTREWILILRITHLILCNTRRHFWSMWRMNTAPHMDVCLSLNPKAYHPTIFSLPQWLQDAVNLLMIRMIYPAMMKNT